jgi:hypothetical protein
MIINTPQGVTLLKNDKSMMEMMIIKQVRSSSPASTIVANRSPLSLE